jgi:hypothetical protein
MFIFDVTVKQSLKTEIVNNTAVLKLYAVQKPGEAQKPGEVIFTSATMNAVGITKAREKLKDKDPVDVEVERVMNVLHRGAGEGKGAFVVSDMPPLQPEHAMMRVTRITASAEQEPLAHLVEIRAFKAMRLITDKQYQDGVKGLIGPERAEALLKNDKEEDRKAVLANAKLLPRTAGKR